MVATGVFDGRTVCTCSLYHTARGRWARSRLAFRPTRDCPKARIRQMFPEIFERKDSALGHRVEHAVQKNWAACSTLASISRHVPEATHSSPKTCFATAMADIAFGQPA